MAQNINIGTKIPGTADQTNNSILEKYCYNDDENNCNTYGGLYKWDEAMQYSTTPGVQGICPIGWHLPSDGEWTTLTIYIGGETVAGGKMKESGYVHWAEPNVCATNSIGFTALPGGTRNNNGSFVGLTISANIWTSTEYSSTSAWYRDLNHTDANVLRIDYDKVAGGFSARCIQD
jgi:uncharacterized protein (TIGR02145 family)